MKRLCAGLLLFLLTPAWAVDVEAYPELASLIEKMVREYQFSEDELVDLFKQVEIRPQILEAMERPKEAVPWFEYKKQFVTADSARRGARFWERNSATLARAGQEYGVAPEIIVAIIGIETQYGRNLGRFSVLNALTTLALEFAPRREYFRGELIQYLLLARDLKLDPLRVQGSYAGAMGMAQFMPSSYRSYAVDFDGDQQRNLSGEDDAIGSIAYYLKQHGWKSGEPVVDEVVIEGARYQEMESTDIKPAVSVKQLKKYGVVPTSRVDQRRLAALIGLQEEAGPLYRLGYHNFYIISRYNRSTNYAMAVYELGCLIRSYYNEPPPGYVSP